MSEKLVAEEGINKGLVLSLDNGVEWVVGRDPDMCQLLIEDPATSRRHMLCRKTKDGVVIENLSRTNPIQVNSAELRGPQLLRNGDTIKIGSGVFRFYVDADAQVHDDQIREKAPKGGHSEVLPPGGREERRDTIFGQEDEEDNAFAQVNFDLSSSSRWLLKVISGPNNGAEFAMEKGHSYLIGTDAKTCDIVFHDLSISRQHGRISVADDESLTIEDLGSRNGTLVDGQKIQGKAKLASNNVVAMGTTSMVTIDRQQEQQTIVPPPLATLHHVVKNEETIQAVHAAVQKVPHEHETKEEKPHETPSTGPTPHPKPATPGISKALIAVIASLFLIGGYGVVSLFKAEEVVTEKIDVNAQLAQTFSDYPSLRYTFSKATGRLMILGHVLTATDRSQLLYNLQSFPWITKIDDNIIIDEFVWQEANQVLSKNPAWRTVNVSSPEPGRFVLTGFLKSRAEANALSDYLSLNFPYPELLEKKMIVEEEVLSEATAILQERGFREVNADISNGEITLSGYIANGRGDDFEKAVQDVKAIPGIRAVRNLVIEQQPEQLMTDLSSQYVVTGYSNTGGANVSVVINGKILTEGDTLDGMKIVSIRPGTIFLEKDGFKYRIDYNK